MAAVAVAGAVAWRHDARVRLMVERATGALRGLEQCELPGTPPESGPVPLPTCRSRSGGEDPWLAAGAHGPELSAAASGDARTEQRRWSWEDVNTVPIVRWDGDTRVVKPGTPGRRLTVRTEVDRARAEAQERAFGYAIPNAVIRYRDDAELAAKRTSLDGVLGRHGVERRRAADGDVLAPDYDWMIDASLDDVRPLARAILAEARRRGARGLREEFGAFASFVQQLKYGDAPEPGDGKHRFGISMPLWTLAHGVGDCDTRAVLLAALTRSIGLCDVHLVRDADHQHMLAAAAVPVHADDRFVVAGGRTLVLVETTDEWPVGHVASRTRGERLQTLYLADRGPAALSARTGAPQASSGPQPIAMRAQRTAPERGTSARSTPQRSRQ